ncbi:MAG: flagellar motor stator protein MotA [Planctomycetes bacterium]|nr:flagellar motor stator protein MotA [Planctomycetota bacterium]
MAVIFGCVFVIASILLGFTMAGGKVMALLHLSEIVTICGASIGALIIMSPPKVLKDLFQGLLQFIKGTPYTKQAYEELLGLFNTLAKMIRRDGLLSLDSHLGDPGASAIFEKYPRISQNHHIMQFLTKALYAILEGNTDQAALTAALEDEIKVIEREHHAAVMVLNKTSDAMPGFGIVAAVLGIVITMGAIDGPASEIGHKVGAALVGTFLGILISYGFLGPLAARLEYFGELEATFLHSIVCGVASMSAGDNPREVLARVLRVVGTDCRPTEQELAQIAEQSA